MKRPQDADRVVEMTYAMSMVVYLVIAVCGYLMYGRDVSDEVSLICFARAGSARRNASGIYLSPTRKERGARCYRPLEQYFDAGTDEICKQKTVVDGD